MDKNMLSGLQLAKMLKFYMVKKSESFPYKRTYCEKGIQAFYFKHKELFEKAAVLFNKHNVDAQNYVKWLVFKCGINEDCVENAFASRFTLSRYAEHLEIR